MHELRFSSTSRSQSSSRIWSIGCGQVGAGVVDQDVDPAHRLDGRRGEPRDVVAAGHVGDDVLDPGRRPRPDLLGRGLELVLVPAGDDDVGARLGEAGRHRLAQALDPPVTRATRPDRSKSFGIIEGSYGERLSRGQACRPGIGSQPAIDLGELAGEVGDEAELADVEQGVQDRGDQVPGRDRLRLGRASRRGWSGR